MTTKQKYTELIKSEANRLGFISCGISKSEFLEEEAPRLEKWLNKNMHGEMKYMENHFDKRLDTTKLVLDSKSVISLLYNYKHVVCLVRSVALLSLLSFFFFFV